MPDGKHEICIRERRNRVRTLKKETDMKRFLGLIIALLAGLTAIRAMSYEEARDRARFLTDKMAYELNLNEQQYNDAYEINLDYLMNIRTAGTPQRRHPVHPLRLAVRPLPDRHLFLPSSAVAGHRMVPAGVHRLQANALLLRPATGVPRLPGRTLCLPARTPRELLRPPPPGMARRTKRRKPRAGPRTASPAAQETCHGRRPRLPLRTRRQTGTARTAGTETGQRPETGLPVRAGDTPQQRHATPEPD